MLVVTGLGGFGWGHTLLLVGWSRDERLEIVRDEIREGICGRLVPEPLRFR